MQHSKTQAVGESLRFILAFACLLSIFFASPDGRAEPADGPVAGSQVAKARAVVHPRIELRQDGGINSTSLSPGRIAQVNVQECDPEIRKVWVDCVLLIYEVQ